MVSVKLGAKETIRKGLTGTRTVRLYPSMTSCIMGEAGAPGEVAWAAISNAQKKSKLANASRARGTNIDVGSGTNLP
jgi:hypothetical protein